VVLSTKARGLHGLLDVEAKHNSVQCNLNRSLVLLVAAGHADRKHGLAVAHHQGRSERDARAFAGY